MTKIIVLQILLIAFSCKSKIDHIESTLPPAKSDSVTINKDLSEVKAFFKGDTLYIYDEKLSWEPFSQEKEDLKKLRLTYPETSRKLNYNDNSEFNDTLITYNLNDNEIIVYANENDKNIRQAKILSNDVLKFNQNIAIGLNIKDLLNQLKVSVEDRKFSSVIICPDEDELQDIILRIDDANRIKEIEFYGYYD
jgi:hypothetical protein